MDIYQKSHGTTTDRFKIGSKNQTMTLTGVTEGAELVVLTNKDSVDLVASSTVFFTIYVLGQGTTNTAAYEIKGCYVSGSNTLTGNAVTTFKDTGNFNEPVVDVDGNNTITVSCIGLENEMILWTALINFITV